VSVYGTVTVALALEVFLGDSSTRIDSVKDFIFKQLLEIIDPDLPKSFLEAINVHTIDTLKLLNRVPPSENNSSAGILTSSSIGYACTTHASS